MDKTYNKRHVHDTKRRRQVAGEDTAQYPTIKINKK